MVYLPFPHTGNIEDHNSLKSKNGTSIFQHVNSRAIRALEDIF